MDISTTCPCCSRPLLHHCDHDREYWFCRHCWTEMPNFGANKLKKNNISIVNLSAKLPTRNPLAI